MDPLQQFMSITGAGRDVASSLLEACDWNVELAIEMHLDNSRGREETEVAAVASGSASSTGRKRRRGGDTEGQSRDLPVPPTIPFAKGEEVVRAPIPPKQEVLVPASETAGSFQRRNTRISRSVFDGFRDFRAETRAQASGVVSGKQKTLEDLFRPPLDVMFGGSFEEAKSAGQTSGKWLLVNIQHTEEFACQALNRDVWSNPTVKQLLREHFVFWQFYQDSAEGEKYKQFYPFVRLPHIAIVDPRTGERLIQLGKVSSIELISIVSDFIAGHDQLQANHSKEPSSKKRKANSIIDASEESQMMAAIAESLAESEPKRLKSKAKIISVDSDSGSSTFHSVNGNSSSDSDSDKVCKVDRKMEEPLGWKSVREEVIRGRGKSTVNQHIKRATRQMAEVDCASNHSVVVKEDRLQSSACALSGDTTDTQLVHNYEQLSLTADRRPHGIAKQTEGEKCQIVDDMLASLEREKDGESSHLVLRFPDGSRKAVSPSASAPLGALLRLVESLGYHMSDYELVTHFPRRNISQLDSMLSLKQSGLYPSETIFIQQIP